MVCYESIVKNVVDVAFFCTITLFLVVVGSNMIFYYFISNYKELTSQKLWKYCANLLC